MDRMGELVKQLNEYAYRYYVLDNPVVSDAEYDALFDELLRLEEETGSVLPDSPTLRVGGKVLEGFSKHTHLAPLYSLDKVKTESELRDWEARVKRACPGAEYSLEYKFDGLTINLTYEGGALIAAATRGDGYVGELITEQVKTIKSVPLAIPFKGKFEVQGEAIMRLSDLAEYNKTAAEPLKNARNACAGALRNLNTAETARRKLDAYFYNVGYIEGKEFQNHFEIEGFLRENRFKISGFNKKCSSVSEIMEHIKKADGERSRLDFLIDGMVVKVSDFHARRELGYTTRFPRWAAAYKFAADEMTSEIQAIIWDVGRTGRVTPTALLEPIEIAGATVHRATLNNVEDIRRKQVGVGSRVFVRRSNDVIPEILGAVPGEEQEYKDFPEVCPACGTELEKIGPNLFCPNTLSCKPQLVAKIVHYVSRDALNIEGLSDKTAALLFSGLNIRDVASLYELNREMLLSLPGFQEKRAGNLLRAIEQSKNPELPNFIYALGINNVGKKTAKDLAEAFHTFEALQNASFSELTAIRDVGDVVAKCITDFFAAEEVQKSLLRLEQAGVRPREYLKKAGAFEGKSVVITGALLSMTRAEASALIEEKGGEVQSSVGKSTDILVYGEKAGSKLQKAKELGTRMMDEKEFLSLIR